MKMPIDIGDHCIDIILAICVFIKLHHEENFKIAKINNKCFKTKENDIHF